MNLFFDSLEIGKKYPIHPGCDEIYPIRSSKNTQKTAFWSNETVMVLRIYKDPQSKSNISIIARRPNGCITRMCAGFLDPSLTNHWEEETEVADASS